MKRIRMVGLCLVAAFAISAVISATASAALPEWVPTQNGTQALKGVSGASKLESPGLPPIECKTAKAAAKLAGTKEITKLKVTFKTCSAEGGAKVCSTKATKPGLIKTNLITGTLGYLEKASTKVGVKLVPATSKPFATFTCGEGAGAIKVEVTGATYGEITGNINVPSATSVLTLTNGGSGPSGQLWENFEGESPHHLESTFNGAGPFASNQQQVSNNTNAKKTKIEIKA